MPIKASVIINYCSNESIFINPLLNECSKFSDDIIVSYGSHLYDGSLEDAQHITDLKTRYPFVTFVEYPVDINLPITARKGAVHRPTAYFHNLARYTATQALKNKEWVFIIDADEIPDGQEVASWLSQVQLDPRVAYKIANYWYFKDPKFRAKTLEDSVLLMHSKYLTENNIFGDFERDHLIRVSGCALDRQTKSQKNTPMFHHFSWVRTKEGLKHKVKNWAHANDIFKGINVDALVDRIYQDDKPNDIVHQYEYDIVPNIFNIQV